MHGHTYIKLILSIRNLVPVCAILFYIFDAQLFLQPQLLTYTHTHKTLIQFITTAGLSSDPVRNSQKTYLFSATITLQTSRDVTGNHGNKV